MVAWPVRAPRGSPHPADRNFYSRATWLESRGPSTWRMPSTIGVAWHVTRTECHSEKSRPPTTFCTTFQQPSTILLLVFVRGYTRSQQSVSRVFFHACTNRWGGGESCLFCFELFETFLFFLPFCSSYLRILRLFLINFYLFRVVCTIMFLIQLRNIFLQL